MRSRPPPMLAPGPFKASQLRSGDPYELSNGHPIHCLPTGHRGAVANLIGGQVVATDPKVAYAGVDAGFTPEKGTLRAPDVAVVPKPDRDGWIPGVPPLALEYAGVGQDEEELQEKIADLLRFGTQFVWVIRLVGMPRVEVYQPGKPMEARFSGSLLEAPGILENPVPVEALYDPASGEKVVFRNLLQRRGYRDLDEVREEGRGEGREEGLREALAH
ncbi:MAG TPA: Uma2 family endonuclease, partial [Myxococcota bacterium]|nr:Uma2 family endonuclease [Myxococcota bacterium]